MLYRETELNAVTPAKAGVHSCHLRETMTSLAQRHTPRTLSRTDTWIPACAGMTAARGGG